MNVRDDLEAAIETVLLADPHVKMAFGNAPQIYTEPPAKDVFPYMILGVQKAAMNEAYDVRLTVVTHRESRVGLIRYLDVLEAVLRAGPIAMPEHIIANRRIRLRDIFTDDSYKTRNGVLHMRFIIKAMETIN